ncbi:hypothetical protein DJ568_00640 [Mucilaginibacter hurinus]|uniref:Uncharacterized protein n=1 Tax=Mucilaginibacter hurinus TaxID=2201324 RepID=A0A367GT20_9SPHI|nr:hypothetical protein [Mucilaginibacter hurinus]RCH56400.1 hypothetical protein DJ568_00640 [Mucilaginibacter hurinus]
MIGQKIKSTGRQEGYGAHVDNAGNIYVKGALTEQGAVTDVDPGPGVVNITGRFYYIVKLDASGAFKWVRRMPLPNCPTVLGSDNSLYYILRDGNYTLQITKVNLSNGADSWTKSLNIPTGLNEPLLATDGNNNVYVSGQFSAPGADLDPGPGVFNMTTTFKNRFIVKLSTDGNFRGAVASPVIYRAYQLLVDKAGNFIVPYTKTGASSVGYVAKYTSTASPVYNVAQGGAPGTLYVDGSSNVYRHYKKELSKFAANGSLVWKRDILYSKFSAVTVDDAGNTYLSNREDYDLGNSTRLVKVTPGGTLGFNKPLFDYTTYATKFVIQYVIPMSLHVTSNGKLYASGVFNGTINFDPTGTNGIVNGPQSSKPLGSVFSVKLNLCN